MKDIKKDIEKKELHPTDITRKKKLRKLKRLSDSIRKEQEMDRLMDILAAGNC